MTNRAFDCIVIGVGGIGSASLYHLARRGIKVLGIDPWPPGHSHGSSHGDSRVIRLVYFEHPDYVPLLRRAFELWEALAAETTVPLLHKTGILQAGPADGHVIQGLNLAATEHGLPVQHMDRKAVGERFPGFDIPDSAAAIFDPSGGILRVEDCVRTHATLAQLHGARLHTGETVRNWHADKHHVNVETDLGRYQCGHLVITPGAWAARLLPKFSPHLHLLRKSLFWFDTHDDCYLLQHGCPVYLFEQGRHTFYGFPALDSKGVKVADHAGGQRIASPADLDPHVNTDELSDVSLMLRHYLPRAGHQLSHHAACMYTMSDDGHFVVGQYPGIKRVHMVAGLSGHGFKFAPVLGEVMADFTVDGHTRHPVSFLSPTRFAGDQPNGAA
jgi:sarcosine oxidase